jgi:hypothetical protein
MRNSGIASVAVARPRMVYWHRDLPPVDAGAVSEHTVEADSARVPGTLAHRNELWNRCYADVMSRAGSRIEQEVERLGGDFAHVVRESIAVRHDDAAGESWLHGRFDFVRWQHSVRSHDHTEKAHQP